jgi:hypothetical protein
VRAQRSITTALLAVPLIVGAQPGSATVLRSRTTGPSLEVEHFNGPAGGLDITLRGANSSGLPGRITYYIPRGFTIEPKRPPGSVVGDVLLDATDTAYGTLTQSALAGAIVVGRRPSQQPRCTVGAYEAVWQLQLSLLGQPLDVPIYLSHTGSGDPRGSGEKITICGPLLPSTNPSVTRRPLPISALELFISGRYLPTRHGDYLWRAVVDPLAADQTTILSTHTYEVDAVLPVPDDLTLTGAYSRQRQSAVLRGRFTANGAPRGNALIQITSIVRKVTLNGIKDDSKIVGTATTDASGTYTVTVPIRGATGYIATARATTTACEGASIAAAGCKSLTLAGARSDPVTLTPSATH